MEAALPRTVRQGVLTVDQASMRAMAPADAQLLANAVDAMGVRSGKAQGLRGAITRWSALQGNGNRLFLAIGKGTVRGLLRVGERQLFVQRDPKRGGYDQISPTCVLDFYVHESCQRGGVGRTLFDAMLSHEGLAAHQLGYDRPSTKLIAFCGRHFGLHRYTPQANHFVVFEEYWAAKRTPSADVNGRSRRSASGSSRGVGSVQRLREEVQRAGAPPEQDRSSSSSFLNASLPHKHQPLLGGAAAPPPPPQPHQPLPQPSQQRHLGSRSAVADLLGGIEMPSKSATACGLGGGLGGSLGLDSSRPPPMASSSSRLLEAHGRPRKLVVASYDAAADGGVLGGGAAVGAVAGLAAAQPSSNLMRGGTGPATRPGGGSRPLAPLSMAGANNYARIGAAAPPGFHEQLDAARGHYKRELERRMGRRPF
jgi:GNAT superfamily N-acetyltransferase